MGKTVKPDSFKLARIAHGERNRIDDLHEGMLYEEATARRQVLLPGVDWATAWAMVKTNGGVRVPVDVRTHEFRDGFSFPVVKHESVEVVAAKEIGTRDLQLENTLLQEWRQGQEPGFDERAEEIQRAADVGRASVGYAVFMHESWKKLPHIVRYFDLIEKNEAPDTPLLEWLIMAGAVDTKSAKATVRYFSTPHLRGRTPLVLDETDRERLRAAIDMRLQLEAEEAAKQAEIENGPGGTSGDPA